MKKIIKYIKENNIIIILFLGIFFIFFNFTSGGMFGDDAIYSTRAIGNIDYMFANNQPTTLQLYDTFPWWANLSNHDHPPLVMWIQHIFLLFGNSIFFSRIHAGVLGLLTVYVIYLLVKKGFSEKVALLASFLILINPYFLWFSKISYLEIGVLFFLTLTLYFFIRFLENNKDWLFFGISLGALLITKYTALFILPAIFFYLFFKEREVFKKKELYLSLSIVLIIIFPVVIYNIMMYKTLGHFDVEWSGIFQQETPWRLNKSLTIDYSNNFISILRILGNTSSYLYLLIFIVGSGYIAINKKIFKFNSNEISNEERVPNVIVFALLFLFIFFIFLVPPSTRFLSIFTVLMSVIVAIFLLDITKNNINDKFKKITYYILFLFLSYQSFFAINSHILYRPLGQENIFFAKERLYDYGVNVLDDYINNLLNDKNVINKIDFYSDLKNKKSSLQKFKLENSSNESLIAEEFYPVIVYDPNISWFSSIWLFERRRLYNNLPFINAQEFVEILKKEQEFDNFYFIKVTDKGPLTANKYMLDFGEKLEKQLIENGFKADLIYRRDGETAFKIYFKP